MGNQAATKAYVTPGAKVDPHQAPIFLALFNDDGTPKTLPATMAFQANTVAADLTAMKADFNALLAKLIAAGVMAPS